VSKPKKYFYAAVVDGYENGEVTTTRYKNFVDFMINLWGDETTCEELRKFLDGETTNKIDYIDFFEDYYGYSTYYVAMDEDGNHLPNLEDNDVTLNRYCKEHNLL
jgi:hypothetical protein